MNTSRDDNHHNVFQIAIDGPVASGKGTVSKTLADRLGFLYVDTGATYRTATLLALRAEVDVNDEPKIVKIVRNAEIDMEPLSEKDPDGGLVKMIVNGEDVSREIRTKIIDANVANVAALPLVRKELVKKQQEIAGRKSVVMEGRDITTAVLPSANLRIFLDARDDVRIKRRVDQLIGQGKKASFKGVAARIKERDRLDRERDADPLRVAPGVWHIDTSDLTTNQVIQQIIDRVQELQG